MSTGAPLRRRRTRTGECATCPHPLRKHGREPGVGCLHVFALALAGRVVYCPCPAVGSAS